MNPFLKKVRVSNFKSIVREEVELKPLTVVVGRNSSGKSSLLHSILLATQHLASDFSADHRISLNRDMVSLGTYSELLNKNCDEADSVRIGIDTPNNSWDVEFGRDLNAQGESRPNSPEAVVRSFRIFESASAGQSRQFDEVTIEFNLSRVVERTVPLLFSQSTTNLRRAVVGEGSGSVRVLDGEGAAPVERSFEHCLFVPQAQRRFHPIPLETIDFFHYLVEQFFAVCSWRVRMVEQRRRPVLATRLVASTRDSGGGSINWPSLRSAYFKHVLCPDGPFDEMVTETRANGGMSADDILVVNLANNVLNARRKWTPNLRKFAEVQQLPNVDRVVMHGSEDLARAVVSGGISALKNELIPVLQQALGQEQLTILKPLSMALTAADNGSEDEQFGDPGTRLMWSLNEGRETLSGAAKNFYYLGPIRDVDFPAPQLRDPRNLGPKGEQAVAVLAHESFAVNSYPTPETMGYTSVDIEFGTALRMWLEHFGLARGVAPADHGRDRPRINVVIDGDGRTVDLRSVGQGLSQVLPVLMQCLLAPPSGSVVVVEQPELHLHPRLESQLADFFLACARTGRQVIVETHSEHLINQLRLQVAEDESDETRDLVRVYFAEQRDGATTFKSAELDPYGGLSGDWPPEFLDLNLEAAERLIDAAIAKRLSELPDDDDEDL